MVEDVDAGFAWEEEEGWEDAYVEDAKAALTGFFAERTGEVFYLKQLEVLFEKRFFHWITAKAANQLIADEVLRAEERPLLKGTRVKFVFHRSHRYYRRQVNRSLSIIREYSRPGIARACGRQAEVLFLHGLASRGFLPVGEETREYKGRKWVKTGHDLDFIVERDGRAYGCEVKNTWDYIDRAEMRVKLDVCEFLGLTPLFIMRYAPKTYLDEIYRRGGTFVIFEWRILPLGQEGLAEQIRETLGLGADCPRAIPAGIVERFVRVHERSLS